MNRTVTSIVGLVQMGAGAETDHAESRITATELFNFIGGDGYAAAALADQYVRSQNLIVAQGYAMGGRSDFGWAREFNPNALDAYLLYQGAGETVRADGACELGLMYSIAKELGEGRYPNPSLVSPVIKSATVEIDVAFTGKQAPGQNLASLIDTFLTTQATKMGYDYPQQYIEQQIKRGGDLIGLADRVFAEATVGRNLSSVAEMILHRIITKNIVDHCFEVFNEVIVSDTEQVRQRLQIADDMIDVDNQIISKARRILNNIAQVQTQQVIDQSYTFRDELRQRATEGEVNDEIAKMNKELALYPEQVGDVLRGYIELVRNDPRAGQNLEAFMQWVQTLGFDWLDLDPDTLLPVLSHGQVIPTATQINMQADIRASSPHDLRVYNDLIAQSPTLQKLARLQGAQVSQLLAVPAYIYVGSQRQLAITLTSLVAFARAAHIGFEPGADLLSRQQNFDYLKSHILGSYSNYSQVMEIFNQNPGLLDELAREVMAVDGLYDALTHMASAVRKMVSLPNVSK